VSWMRDKNEVEIVDLVLRLREKLVGCVTFKFVNLLCYLRLSDI